MAGYTVRHHVPGAARWAILLMALPVLACTNHTFAPGPGMAANQFEPDSARCRMFSRGMVRQQGFFVAGREQFVLAAAAGAVIGSAISGAIQQNQNFNDCMMASGWQPIDGPATPTSGPVGARLAIPDGVPDMPTPPALVVAQTVAQPTAPLPATPMLADQARHTASRRAFGAAVMPIAMPFNGTSVPRGTPSLVVVDVEPGSAAASAGLRRGDIIVAFAGNPALSVEHMQGALHRVAAGDTVPVELWRDQSPMSTSVRF